MWLCTCDSHQLPSCQGTSLSPKRTRTTRPSISTFDGRHSEIIHHLTSNVQRKREQSTVIHKTDKNSFSAEKLLTARHDTIDRVSDGTRERCLLHRTIEYAIDATNDCIPFFLVSENKKSYPVSSLCCFVFQHIHHQGLSWLALTYSPIFVRAFDRSIQYNHKPNGRYAVLPIRIPHDDTTTTTVQVQIQSQDKERPLPP